MTYVVLRSTDEVNVAMQYWCSIGVALGSNLEANVVLGSMQYWCSINHGRARPCPSMVGNVGRLCVKPYYKIK